MLRTIRKSFSGKIITLVIVNVIVTSLVVGFVTMKNARNFLSNKINEKFPSILVNTKAKIEIWYSQKSRELSAVAGQDTIIENIQLTLANRDSPDGERAVRDILAFLESVRRRYPTFEDIGVLDSYGDIMMSTSTAVLEDADALKLLKEENLELTAVSEAIFMRDGTQAYQWLIVPVEIGDDANPSICAKFYLDDIENLLSDVSINPYGDLYILDLRGRFLTQPRQVSVSMLGEKAMEVPTRQDRPLYIEKYKNFNDRKVFGAKVFLEERGWWLVCEEDYNISLSPVFAIRNKIFVADILIIAVFILAALKIVRSILSPIHSLSIGAKKVTEGMVAVNIPESSHDEIGLMISAFNEMSKAISLAKVELQAKNKMLNQTNQQLLDVNEQLETLSVTDGLTNLFNHRHFWNIMNTELSRANLYKGDLALIIIDIDDFKKVNDQFGHSVGDDLLVSIANTLKNSIRETDIVSRYGGEEFAVLLPDTNKNGVYKVAEKIRKAVEDMRFKVSDTDIIINVTVSIGISVFKGDRRDFFNAADRALYISKSKGKNQVNFATG